jgi:hypothetical protein
VVLVGLGALLIYLAFRHPPGQFLWQAFLIVFGVVVLALADWFRRATHVTLELTDQELRESTGRILFRVEDATRVERGAFALKPSNGFLVHLKARQPRVWAPGLWWRGGRRVGVGGVTSAGQAKAMAEILSAMIAQRQ